MAKTPSYTDDQLLEAVIKYSDAFKGKIKAAALAEWASENVDGMEGVRGYHFLRPQTITDPRTGKKIKKERPCTKRIREQNKARDIALAIKGNVLLSASNFGAFRALPTYEQDKLILDTRRTFSELSQQNETLRIENTDLRYENDDLKKALRDAVSNNDDSVNTLEVLKKQVDFILADMNDKLCEEAMKKIGITKDELKISLFNASRAVNRQFSIKNAIRQMEAIIGQAEEAPPEEPKSLADQLIDGLDF